ncbi:hypothetical protein [Streptococcus sp. DD13]|uniref:hypothetical protein n=1 Tax=Streptococcus sp. DD13 TaxID=1777881 RepID=UPI000799A8CC|nr:hypothetical protein [Streptococcus sp. DD13]KXT78460.1 hypothetical protein STRDD13_00763 [Streptococcus sp. DD13]
MEYYDLPLLSSFFLTIRDGQVYFKRGDQEGIQLEILSWDGQEPQQLPNVEVDENQLRVHLFGKSQVTVYLPECWLSILELKVGQASVNLEYAPFEDITIESSSDKNNRIS